MKRLRGALRWIFVTVGVIALTSITADATLSPNGFSQSALGIIAGSAVEKDECPSGMVLLTTAERRLCIDEFESSPDATCPMEAVQNAIDTRSNIDNPLCVPHSSSGEKPWTHITFNQAYELCARAGKRLPTPEEWYQFSIGTPDSINTPVCNTRSSSVLPSDENSKCKNGIGVYNAIGNAWEWVDGEVENGSYDERTVPESGYVAGVDRAGVAEKTVQAPEDQYYRDYFWSEQTGSFALLRGGFFGSGDDAGIYSVQAKTAPDFSSEAIGFRCVVNI